MEIHSYWWGKMVMESPEKVYVMLLLMFRVFTCHLLLLTSLEWVRPRHASGIHTMILKDLSPLPSVFSMEFFDECCWRTVFLWRNVSSFILEVEWCRGDRIILCLPLELEYIVYSSPLIILPSVLCKSLLSFWRLKDDLSPAVLNIHCHCSWEECAGL